MSRILSAIESVGGLLSNIILLNICSFIRMYSWIISFISWKLLFVFLMIKFLCGGFFTPATSGTGSSFFSSISKRLLLTDLSICPISSVLYFSNSPLSTFLCSSRSFFIFPLTAKFSDANIEFMLSISL